jgi:hypothetical protein
VLARRSGDKWYVAGINARDSVRVLDVPLPFLGSGQYNVQFIGDGDSPRAFETRKLRVAQGASLGANLAAYGGFVAVVSPVD